MSFRDFLDASYALMAEEHQRIDPFKNFLSVREETVQPKVVQNNVAEQNIESMNLLESMTRSVQGMPKIKPRRAKK